MSSRIAEIIVLLLSKKARKDVEKNLSLLHAFTDSSDGKNELNALLQSSTDEIRLCTLAFLHKTTKMSHYKQFSFCIEEVSTEHCLKLGKLLLEEETFESFVKGWENNDGFRQDWFHNAKNSHLRDHERLILATHYCMAIREGIKINVVQELWQKDRKSLHTTKKTLIELFEDFKLPKAPLMDDAVSHQLDCAGNESFEVTISTDEAKYPPDIENNENETSPSSVRPVHLDRRYLGETDETNGFISSLTSNSFFSPPKKSTQRPACSPIQPQELLNQARKHLASPSFRKFLSPSSRTPAAKRGRHGKTPAKTDDAIATPTRVYPSQHDGSVEVVFASEFPKRLNFASMGEKIDSPAKRVSPTGEDSDSHFEHTFGDSPEKDDTLGNAPRVTPTEEQDVNFSFDNTGQSDDEELPPGMLPSHLEENRIFEKVVNRKGLRPAVDAITKEGTETESFSVHLCGKYPRTFMRVPMTFAENFERVATTNKWTERLLELAGRDMTKDETAAKLMAHLAKRHPKALDICAEKGMIKGLLKTRDPMDAAKTAAMTKDANLKRQALRTVNRYCRDHFGIRLTSPEKKVSKLAEKVVIPKHETMVIDNEHIKYWYRYPTDVVKTLLEHAWRDVEYDNIDVIFGGDHGARVFSAAIKVVLSNKEGKTLRRAVVKIAHVTCKKDTYEILSNTITNLDDSFNELKFSKIRIRNGQPGDASSLANEVRVSFVPLDEASDDEDETSTQQDDDDQQGLYQYKYVQPTVKITGDLAFISICLGKENMSGVHCYLCDCPRSRWQFIQHQPGSKMTLAMQEEYRKAYEKGIKDGTTEIHCGCKDPPLFTFAEPWDYIIPCLHVMIGAYNATFSLIFAYVDGRHEQDIPQEEKNARKAKYLALIEYKKSEEAKASLKVAAEQRRLELDVWIKETTEMKAKKIGKHYVLSRNQRKDLNNRIDSWKDEKRKIRDDLKDMEEQCKDQKKVLSERNAALKALEKKRTTASRKMRALIDEVLKQHGVDRGHTHGGDFNGVACLALDNHIDEIMEKIKSTLITSGNGDVKEIEEMMESFRVHFLLLSHMFALARTPREKLQVPQCKESILAQLKEVVHLVDVSTERLGQSMLAPKRHSFSDHIVEMIDINNGIAEFFEDWVEQLHQFELKYKDQARALGRNAERLALFQCREEWKGLNENVRRISKEVAERSKRNFKKKRSKLSQEEEQIARHKRRLENIPRAKELFKEEPILRSAQDRSILELQLEIEAELQIEYEDEKKKQMEEEVDRELDKEEEEFFGTIELATEIALFHQ